VYGHLNNQYIQLFNEIETFDSKDPMGKVMYGIRPSTFDKYKRNIEDSFLKHKKHVEATVTDVVAKLSTWHTYFGLAWGGEAMELEAEQAPEDEVGAITEGMEGVEADGSVQEEAEDKEVEKQEKPKKEKKPNKSKK
jgi:hypothetical protein